MRSSHLACCQSPWPIPIALSCRLRSVVPTLDIVRNSGGVASMRLRRYSAPRDQAQHAPGPYGDLHQGPGVDTPDPPLRPRGLGARASLMPQAALTTPKMGSSTTKAAKQAGASSCALNQASAAVRQPASVPPAGRPIESNMTARRRTRSGASSTLARRTSGSRPEMAMLVTSPMMPRGLPPGASTAVPVAEGSAGQQLPVRWLAVHQANRRVEDLEVRPIGADDRVAMPARCQHHRRVNDIPRSGIAAQNPCGPSSGVGQ